MPKVGQITASDIELGDTDDNKSIPIKKVRQLPIVPLWQTTDNETVRLYHGSALKVAERLQGQSVQTIVTSPPYWGLRDYGTRSKDELGTEKTPEEYIEKMVILFRELRRVLRNDGTVWLNLGDSYSGPKGDSHGNKRTKGLDFGNASGGHVTANLNMPNGNLVGIPWRVALALQADGWVLRQDILWIKRDPMPESIRNRCTKAHEYIFLLAKSMNYYYDHEAIKEDSVYPAGFMPTIPLANSVKRDTKRDGMSAAENHGGSIETLRVDGSRNKRSWWDVTSGGYPGAHFACVDSETECLTKQGWRRQHQLTDGELILSYNRYTSAMEWQPATFHRYDHDGMMVQFDKRDTSQLLTLNHRCIIKTRDKFIRVKQAESVSGGDSLLMCADVLETPEKSIGEDYASLMGWILSEGSVTKYDVRIYQSNTANPENVIEIENLIKILGTKHSIRRRLTDRYRAGEQREEVTFVLKDNIKRFVDRWYPNKSIPDLMTRLPLDELSAFLRSFIKGDGHTRVDGRVSIIQKRKDIIEQLQVIAIKLGYRAILSHREDRQYCLYLTRGQWLNVRGTNGKWEGHTYKKYTGIVWCPNVESGFWMARRNGKPFITGNTFPPKLIEPCIKAGTSEYGCCARCGDPYKRIVERREQRIKNNEQLKRDRTVGNRNGKGDSTLDGEIGTTHTIGWEKTCICDCDEIVPCTVLDPFMGAATTAIVSLGLGRRVWGIELSKKYILCNQIPRIEGDLYSRPSMTHLIPDRS